MSYVHLAHDCHVGDGAILVNSVQLAGHVTVGEKATVIVLRRDRVRPTQFVKIGQYSVRRRVLTHLAGRAAVQQGSGQSP